MKRSQTGVNLHLVNYIQAASHATLYTMLRGIQEAAVQHVDFQRITKCHLLDCKKRPFKG